MKLMDTYAQLHWISGKGGVGKSTLALKKARACSQGGHRTLLVEMNSGGALFEQLGIPYQPYRIVPVSSDLWLIDINPYDAMMEYARMILKFDWIVRLTFENKFIKKLLRLVPALAELVMLGKIWYHSGDNGQSLLFQDIIVDCPATGHALALWQSPLLVAEQVPAGPLRENSRLILSMLQDPSRSQVYIVTSLEQFALTEAQMLYEGVKALNMAFGQLWVNRYIPPLPFPIPTSVLALQSEDNRATMDLAMNFHQETTLHFARTQQQYPHLFRYAQYFNEV
jgi:anion-transporting  ArsA/GET3 family ATPase